MKEYTPQELALTVRKIIESKPGNWQQAVWYGYESHMATVDSIRDQIEEGDCGTVACVAGWTAILVSPEGTKLTTGSFGNNFDSVRYPDGTRVRIHTIAKDAFKLTDDQAEWLFDSTRGREEVISYLTDIENGML